MVAGLPSLFYYSEIQWIGSTLHILGEHARPIIMTDFSAVLTVFCFQVQQVSRLHSSGIYLSWCLSGWCLIHSPLDPLSSHSSEQTRSRLATETALQDLSKLLRNRCCLCWQI